MITAVDNEASGLTSEDVGVEESGSTTDTQSLQLIGSGSNYTDFA